MYRCYLIRNGRIAWGEYVDLPTTEEAKVGARALWMSHPEGNSFTGIEVWKGATLVYRDEDHADQAGTPEPIASPFETAESTIYATWRPTEARPIGMSDNVTRLSAKQPHHANWRVCPDGLWPADADKSATGGGIVSEQLRRAKSKVSGRI